MIPDETLARAARAGDRAAFDTLVDRHARRVFLFAYARLRDRHDAEEAAQETFLKVWSARRRFDDRRSFATWLFAVAYRETVNVVRRRQREARARDAQREAPTRPAHDLVAEGNIWALASRVLDDEGYTALYLRYVGERTPREIASILGRSSAWARVTLHRARQRLEKELGEEPAGEEGYALAFPAGGAT